MVRFVETFRHITLLTSVTLSACFQSKRFHFERNFRSNRNSQALSDVAINSLVAGSLAGVVGIGTAYPLDVLKTKTQMYASNRNDNSSIPSMIEMSRIILREEGLQGFYNGVAGVMIGEAFVKASLFGSNSWALSKIAEVSGLESYSHPSFLQLSAAAAFSGFASSFVLNPIERVKILMQADKCSTYTTELDCISTVIRNDGLTGLIFRGLDAMMVREIPGCTVYFLVYTLLMSSPLTSVAGPTSAFISGAAAGILAWIPIYPSDVVKTYMQNTLQGDVSSASASSGRVMSGDDSIQSETHITTGSIDTSSTAAAPVAPAEPAAVVLAAEEKQADRDFLRTVLFLQREFGVGVFFDGIQPKLLRAGVNHSVTFFIYDLIMKLINT